MIDLLQLNAPSFMELLPEALEEKVRAISTPVRYADGQMIHSRGDPEPGISIVRTGAVYVGAYGFDGSFVMTSILGPGQTFGEFTLFAELRRTHDVSAAGPTEIYQIEGARFTRLYDQEPDISRALLSSSLVRMHLLLEILDAIRRLPMRERTAKMLLVMVQTSGASGAVSCRQSDLAFTLGVSLVSVGKALKELQDLGLVELKYGRIELPDVGRLAAWVGRHDGTEPGV